jgi:hypothetical protein
MGTADCCAIVIRPGAIHSSTPTVSIEIQQLWLHGHGLSPWQQRTIVIQPYTRQDMGLPGPESIFGAVSVTQNWKFIIVRCVRLSLHTSERGGRGVPYRTVMLGIPTLHHPVRGRRTPRCSSRGVLRPPRAPVRRTRFILFVLFDISFGA